jgi:transposase
VSHAATIEAYFHAYPPASVKEARDKIQEWTGIQRSPTQVRQFLRSLGMRPRKVGMIPAKGDAKTQDAFKKKSWSRD